MTLPPSTGQSAAAEFSRLGSGVGAGSVLPEGWQWLAERPLLILVGPTGVGKSTTVKQLARLGLRFTLLPDRRVLTDRLIIAPLAAADGRAEPVTCRLERLEYARRYRQQHPGGMAEILRQVAVATASVQSLLLFDGLRGQAEVSYAAQALPQATFAMLDAPNQVRLHRMLHRGDPFDRVQVTPREHPPQLMADWEAIGVPEAAAHLPPEAIAELVDWVKAGLVMPQELRGKLKVIVEQAQVYQPEATRAVLQQLAGDRAVIADTSQSLPDRVAAEIVAKLRERWPRTVQIAS